MKAAKYIVFSLLLFTVFSCSSTVHLRPDQYLLRNEPKFEYVVADSLTEEGIQKPIIGAPSGEVSSDILWSSIRSHPNRRMGPFKTYLHLYNAGVSLKENDFSFERFYRRIFPKGKLFDSLATLLVTTMGEEPVIVDTAQLNADARNLESTYFSHGFFHTHVHWKIDTSVSMYNPQKASVTFQIYENAAYILDEIVYDNPKDKGLLKQVLEKSVLHPGMTYNENALAMERAAITKVMKANGFFAFSISDIAFEADTLPERTLGTLPKNANITSYNPVRLLVKVAQKSRQYSIASVRIRIEPSEVFVSDIPWLLVPGQIPDSVRKLLRLPQNTLHDSLRMSFVVYDRITDDVNLNHLNSLILMKPGMLYNAENEKKTQRYLSDLGIFKFVLINYEADDSTGQLYVDIEAKLYKRYQMKAGLEGFSQSDQVLQSNLPGIGGSIALRDKMLFRGSARFESSTRGNVSFYRTGKEEPLQEFYELGIKASLVFPRFVSPVFRKYLRPGKSPSTTLTLDFRSQQRSEFDRTVLGFNWNYSWYHWSHSTRLRSSLSPSIVNFIQSHLTQDFQNSIDSLDDFLQSFIALDFSSRFSSRTVYKYTFSDYGTLRTRATHFFQSTWEYGGNVPFLLDRFGNVDGSWKDHKLDVATEAENDIFYGQFFKTSAEYKIFVPLGRKAEFVGRAFTGLSDPWNFTTQVPFDARFFSGGTNSMRAWQSNTLGPGTFSPSGNESGQNKYEFLLSPGGESILELNAELRFNVHKYLELAFFSDAGNVWFLPWSSFAYDEGKLSRKTALQLGWDAGIGFRLDFSFLIFRIDLAKQIYAPDSQQFVVKSFKSNLVGERFQVNFGIGYPF